MGKGISHLIISDDKVNRFFVIRKGPLWSMDPEPSSMHEFDSHGRDTGRDTGRKTRDFSSHLIDNGRIQFVCAESLGL